MDQETKATISQIQRAIWKLQEAYSLLNGVGVDGMEYVISRIEQSISDLDRELEEIRSLERT